MMDRDIEKIKIAVAVATISSSPYIYNALVRYMKEMQFLSPTLYEVELVVCLNGVLDDEYLKAKSEILRFHDSFQTLKLTLIERSTAGKNEALNDILHDLRKKQVQVVHFLDDDVKLKPGSVLLNVSTLIAEHSANSRPMLVGSNSVVVEQTFKDFLHREKSVIGAVCALFWYNIFKLPYIPGCATSKSVCGQSYAAFVDDMPVIPKSGLMDDTFVNNYFVLRNRKAIEQDNVEVILKPVSSVAYFNVAASLDEWLKQKGRTHVGLVRASKFFDDDFDFLEMYFASAFSYLRKYRTSPQLKGLNRIKYFIFERLLRKLEKESRVVLESNTELKWNTARSTKTFRV